jgi:hypothetical protein
MAISSKHRTLWNNIGKALSTWSMVEMGLAKVFSNISTICDSHRAYALFDSIINFDARLAVVDRLMTLEQVDEVEAEMWKRMSVRLGKFYSKRHELAHFTLGLDRAENPILLPFTTIDKMLHPQGQKQLTVAQVKERSKKFVELQAALNWFAWQALMRQGPLPEGVPWPQLPEPPLVVQLRGLAIQILEERKQRPQQQPQ